tara:strand:- start:65 stop:721 length:657 start_codon:yes stop_codon:yes gene_type:complete
MNTFKPNLTSSMLLDCASAIANSSFDILDLGCGSGYVGLELSKKIGLKSISCSDLDPNSLHTVQKGFDKLNVDVDFRHGSLFEPWNSELFDLIIDDVSGVSKLIAEKSPWFKNVPCESGSCGTRLVNEVIKEAPNFLKKNGKLIFPIISLSKKSKIIDLAEEIYGNIQLFKRKEWFLPESMMLHKKLLDKERADGNISFDFKFGKVICFTEIYVVSLK